MSNIEKIRQEIERRRDFFYERYLQKGIGCIEETRYDECVEILSFIDSLPDCTVKTNGQGRVKDDVYDSLPEEKPSEDLEEAAEEYAYRGIPDEIKQNVKPIADEIIKQFIAGAEWQKEHSFKPTQEHLDALDTVYKTHGADSACRHVILNLLNQLKST